MKKRLRSNNSCVYKLQYHLVLTTKYRKKIISNEIKNDLINKFNELLDTWDCKPLEINTDQDHIHLLFEAHPSLQLSVLINNLKTVTSRYIRKNYSAYLDQFYWGTDSFWNKSYCLLSTGGATIDVIKNYIQNQDHKSNSSITKLL